jgi:transcriptional regulator with XRE-family HTH domain
MKIGDNIKKIRKEKGISQKSLAKMLDNMPVSTLANYENNYRIPDIKTVAKIANILQVDINDLIGIDHEKEREENINKFKNDMANITTMTEIYKKMDAGTATADDINVLKSFSKTEDILNLALFGPSKHFDLLPPEAVSYLMFIKFLETLGYKSNELKINTATLFTKVKYQIKLEIGYSEENNK